MEKPGTRGKKYDVESNVAQSSGLVSVTALRLLTMLHAAEDRVGLIKIVTS